MINQGVPTLQFGSTRVPLLGGSEGFVWSLLSLLLMIASTILAVLVLAKMLISRRNGEDTENDLFRIIAVAIGAVSLIGFFILYNLNSLMVILDIRTIFFAVFLSIEILLLVMVKVKNNGYSR